MLATLKVPNGVIVSQTIVINGEVTYQIILALKRHRARPFSVKVQALTTLGHTTVAVEHFTELSDAQATFEAYFNDLAEK
ncbi:hypothetical protein [Lactiplantibacillus songbeiensis]|uniref:Uncharacterized protein n=1 Tax=Lactiplantibacillus songbeiensis TaxID=2559920 RepID=A0ABW4C4C2_9LACO|nr:hypothetical protein [Lactiplantibacillus songbeiensis]